MLTDLCASRSARRRCSQWYEHAHARPMPIRSLARMVQTILYGNRFFPLYTYVILGGIDETDGACPDPPL